MKTISLTIQQAAKLLNVNPMTLRRWEEKGILVPQRTEGNQRRYQLEDIQNFKKKKPNRISTPVLLSDSNTIAPQETFPKVLSNETNNLAVSDKNPAADNKEVAEEIFEPTKKIEVADAPSISPKEIPAAPLFTKIVPPLSTMENEPDVQVSTTPSESFSLYKPSYASRLKLFADNLHTKSPALLAGLVLIAILGTGTISYSIYKSTTNTTVKQFTSAENTNRSVLAAQTKGRNLMGDVLFNVPAIFAGKVTVKNDFVVNGKSLFTEDVTVANKNLTLGTGKLTASNVVYGLTAGANVTITGDPQNPTISAGITGGVESFQGQSGIVTLTEGDGIGLDGLTITNTGVLSLGGETGDVELSAGDGITIDGTTISNDDPGSAQNIFKTILVDATEIIADSNDDTLEFIAGTGVTLTPDATNNTITIDAAAGTSQWTTSGSDISYTTGNVGIGTGSPGRTLDVTGTARVTGGVTFSAFGTGILHTDASGILSSSAINLGGGATEIIGTLPIANGGTGATTFTSNGVLYGNGSGTLQVTSAPTAGQMLLGNGSGVPTFTTLSGGATLSGTGALSLNLSQSGSTASVSANSGLEFSTSSGLSLLRGCSNGQILKWNTTNSMWECASDSGGSVGIINVENTDTPIGASVDTLDFGADFLLSASPANEANITIADDVLNFSEFADSLTLDATTNVALTNFDFNLGTNGGTGKVVIAPNAGGDAAVIINKQSAVGDIFTASASGTTRLTLSNGGVLNLISGAYQIAGTTVLSGTALGTGITGSSLTSVGALDTGSIVNGFGSIFTANTIQGSDITASGTTGFNATGNDADLTFSGTGNHVISASTGTLTLGPFTLNGAVTGNGQDITGVDALSASGTITFASYTSNGGILYTNGSGQIIQVAAGASNQILHGGTSPSFGSVQLGAGGDVTGTLLAGNGGTGFSTYTQGDLLYGNGSNTLSRLGLGGDGSVLTVSGGNPAWISSSSINFWQRSNGVLSPLNLSDDLLLGATATNSARFAFTGVAGGTPTASISGSTANNALYLTGDGTIGTTNKQSLTFGSASTGNIVFNGFGAGVLQTNGSGVVSAGTITVSNGGTGTTTFTGNGILYGNGTGAVQATAAGTDGQVLMGQTSGAPVYRTIGGDATINSADGTLTIAAGAVALTTDTSGDYVATITSGNGISASATGEGSTPTINLAALTSNWDQTGAFDISLNNAGSELRMLESAGGAFFGTLDVGDLAADKTYVLPNFTGASANICLDTGNCAGTGGGITGAGTAGQLAYFTGAGAIASENSGFAWDATNDRLGIGNDTPFGKLDINGASSGKALVILNETGNQNILVGSSSGTTRFAFDGSGNLNLASGAYQIGGASVLNSTTLGTSVINSSLQTVGTIGTGIWQATAIGAQYGGTGDNTSATTGVPYIATGNWQYEAQLASARGGTGADLSAAAQGAVPYFSATGVMSALAPGSAGFVLTTNGAGQNPSWTDSAGLGTNYWNQANGVLSPKLASVNDLLLGSNATASARFAFINVNSGTPTASIAAGTTNNGTYLTGTGVLGTTNAQTLAIGSGSTGNIVIDSGSGQITLADSTNFLSNIVVSGSTQLNGSFTQSGAVTFSTGTGAVSLNGDTTIQSDNTFTIAALTTNGGLLYTNGTGGLVAQTAAGNPGQVLQSNGSGAPTWVDATSLGTNYWQQNQGALAPLHVSNDLLLGSNATSSARFAFTGVAGGTPTASISGSTANNALYITGNGNLATTNKQSLTIGSASTGDIVLSGFGAGVLQTNASGVISTGTISVSSGGTGATTFASNGVLFGNGTGAIQAATAGTDGQILVGQSGGAPIFRTLGGDAAINSATGNLTIAGNAVQLGTDTTGDFVARLATGSGILVSGTLGEDSVQTVALGALTGDWDQTGAFDIVLNNSNSELRLRESTGSFLGTIDVADLDADKIYVLPNFTGASADICLSTGNCAGGAGGSKWQLNGNVIAPLTLTNQLSLGGSTTTDFLLGVSGAQLGKALVSLNETGNQNILTASASGATVFNITKSGNIEMLESSGSTFFGTLAVGDLAANKTYVLPNFTGASADICLTTGNCAGSGGGITGAGTIGQITYFDGTGNITSENSGFAWDATNNRLGIGNDSPLGKLDVSGASTGKALLMLNETGNQDIFTASSSGVTRLSLSNAGNLNLTGGVYQSGGSSGITQGTPSCVTTTGGIVTGFGVCQLGSEQWVVNSGSIYTGVQTLDLLLGGTSTASARFAVLNMAGGTPAASISAGTANNATFLSGAGNLGTTNAQTLQLGGSSTGNIVIDSGNGVVRLADLTTNGVVYTSGTDGTLTSEAVLSSVRGGTGANLSAAAQGAIPYFSATGVMSALGPSTAGFVLTTNGAGQNPTWTDSATLGTNFWDRANGVLSPKYASVYDLLLGSSATSSAKFAFTGVNSGTPTASISAGLAGGISLDATGRIQTTANQSLTLGGGGTGNVVIDSGNGQIFLQDALTQTGTGQVTFGGNIDATSGLDVTGSDLTVGGSSASISIAGIIAGAQLNIDSTLRLDGTTLSSIGGGNDLTLDAADGNIFFADGDTLNAGGKTAAAYNFFANNADAPEQVGIDSDNDLYIGGSLEVDGIIYQGDNQVCDNSGNCAGTTNYWQLNSGSIAPGNAANAADRVVIGGTSTTTAFQFEVNGKQSGKALVSLNETGNQDIFTASSAGTTRFRIANNGDLIATGGLSGLTSLTSGGTVTFSGVTANRALFTDGSSNLTGSGASSALVSALTDETGSGLAVFDTSPTFTTSILGAGTGSFDLINSGVTTLNVGSAATAINMGAAGATVTLGSGGNATITTATNGNLILSAAGSGNTTLSSDFNSSIFVGNASTPAPLSISGGIGSNASFIVNQTNSGNLIAASASGVTRFLVDNSGNITVGTWQGTAIAPQFGGTGDNTSGTTGVPYIAAGNWQYEASLDETRGGTGLATYVQGDLLYASAADTLARRAIGSSGQVLTVSAGLPTWVDPSTLANSFWQRNLGAVAPTNITDDVLFGGTSTTSAKFAFINNIGAGTPTASISAGSNNATFLTGAGNLGTSNAQTLTLGGISTGNIVLDAGSGLVSVADALRITGNVDANNGLDVTGADFTVGGTNATITTAGVITGTTINATTAIQTGSTTRIDSSGNLSQIGTIDSTFLDAASNNVNLAASTNLQLNGTTVITSGRNLESIAGVTTDLTPTANNTYDLGSNSNRFAEIHGQTLYQAGNQVCDTGGNCSGLSVTYWDQANGAISAKNSTVDLLVGGTSTASAKFAIINVAGNAPVASLSGATGGSYLSAAGTLQTTNNQTLNIGGNSTGNIVIDSNTGNITLADNTTLTQNLTIAGSTGLTFSATGGIVLNGGTISDNSDEVDINDDLAVSGALQVGTNSLTTTYSRFGNATANGANLNASNDLLIQGALEVDDLFYADGGIDTTFTQGSILFAGASGVLAENNSNFFWDNTNARLGLGTTSPLSRLDIRGQNATTPAASISALSTFAGLVVDNNGSGDLFSASKSGATKFTILNSGNLQLANYTTNNGVLYTNASGVVQQSGTGGDGSILTLSGGTPTWVSSSSINYWQRANNAISPLNITDDLLLGGSSTTSARFAFINNSGPGTPTASISAGTTNNAAYLTGTGVLGTTNRQSLTIGSTSTGNISLNPGGSATLTALSGGNIGIGTTNPSQRLEIQGGNLLLNNGGSGILMRPDNAGSAFVLGSGSNATLGDFYFQTTGGGNNSVVLGATGAMGLGTTTPTAMLDVAGAASVSGSLSFRNGTGTIQTTQQNNLVLGGNTTGNILLNSDGSNYVTIGNVTNPNAALEVAGDVDISNTLSVSSYAGIGVSASSDTMLRITPADANTRGLSIRNQNGQVSNLLELQDAGLAALTWFDDVGNLRIGATAPDTGKLNITGAYTGKALAILNETGNQDIFTASSAGTTRFRIANNGQIAISSLASCNTIDTDANGVLSCGVDAGSGFADYWQLNGNALSPNNSTYDLLLGGTATTSARFAFINNTGSGAPTASIAGNLSLAVPTGANPAANLNVFNGGSLNIQTSAGGNAGLASRLYIANNGNIGIGDTNPWATLTVNGNANFTETISNTDLYISQNIFSLQNGSSNDAILFNYAGKSNATFDFYDGNSTVTSRINPNGPSYFNGGAVGIGTTTPLATLDVRGTSGTTPIASFSGRTAQAGVIIDNSGNGDILSASSSGATRFTINNLGNFVFQGSTYDAFTTTLQVSDPTANRTITIPNNSGVMAINTSGSAVSGTSAFVQGGQTWATAAILGTNDANALHFETNNSVKMAIDTNGNVSIGSTSPLSTLDVRGVSGTTTIASFSGRTAQSGVIVDNSGVGDLFSASTSGMSRFTVTKTGALRLDGNGTDTFMTPRGSSIQSKINIPVYDPGDFGQVLAFGVPIGANTTARALAVLDNRNGPHQPTIATFAPDEQTSVGFSWDGSDTTSYIKLSGSADTLGIRFNNNYDSGTQYNPVIFSIAGNTPIASFSGRTGKAGIIVDNNAPHGDIFAASKSGATKFVIKNNGNLQFAGTTNFLSTIQSAATAAQTWTLPNESGTLCVQGSSNCGFSVGSNFWQAGSAGTISPYNNTVDLLVGGTSTASAKFAVLNMTGAGVPTASIAGTTSNLATYMTGNGAIGTTNKGTLTLGTTSTGNIALAPGGATALTALANGNVGIGTTNPNSKLDVNGHFSNGGFNIYTATWFDTDDNSYLVDPSAASGISAKFAGSVGIGTTNPLATLDVRGTSGTTPIASFSGITAKAGLVVNNNGVGDIFTASKSGKTFFTVKNNGVIQMGSTTNGLSFDYLNGGPNFTGTARPIRKIVLSPEYSGGILTASGSATTDGDITADASTSANINIGGTTNNFITYYEWNSAETTAQDYTIAVRVTLPPDFSSWVPGSQAMQIVYNTELATATSADDNKLELRVIPEGQASNASAPSVYRQNVISSTSKTWRTLDVSASDLIDAPSFNSASSSAMLYLKVSSRNNNYVQVGDIILNYLSKF